MTTKAEQVAFHTNKAPDGHILSPKEREVLLKKYLPAAKPSMADSTSPSPKSKRRHVVRPFVKDQLHFFLFTVLHFFFSIYIRLRILLHAMRDRVYAISYYHHRTPEYIQRDIRNLKRLPKHLSVILDLDEDERNQVGLERLLNDVGEIAAWSVSAGIPALSVYEKTGMLKKRLDVVHYNVTKTFQSYFSAPNIPTLSVGAPSKQSYSPPHTPPSDTNASGSESTPHLRLLLLGESDGRSTMVDLTKIFAYMAQQKKISVDDVSGELINAEINAAVMDEPELLVLFGPQIVLQGYPPWHVRLTEIFHVPDNHGVEYQVFIRALHRYAKAEMRLGK